MIPRPMARQALAMMLTGALVTQPLVTPVALAAENTAAGGVAAEAEATADSQQSVQPEAATSKQKTASADQPAAQAGDASAPAADQIFAGGEGTEASPFEVSSLAQLKAFRDSVNAGTTYAGKYIKLTADVDLNNEEWAPIGTGSSFAGAFDGDGHTVKNLKVSQAYKTVYNPSTTLSNGGLFGYVDGGTLKGVTVENADVTGNQRSAGIIGDTRNGKVENCHVKGSITIKSSGYSNSYAGGIAAYSYSDIASCTVTQSGGEGISGVKKIGGLAGYIGENKKSITDNTVTNVVLSGGSDTGGLVGAGHGNQTFTGNRVENAKVSGSASSTAGLIGRVIADQAEKGGRLENNTVASLELPKGGATLVASYQKSGSGKPPASDAFTVDNNAASAITGATVTGDPALDGDTRDGEDVAYVTVTYKKNDGTDATISTSKIVKGSAPVNPTSNPKRDGYVFKGWFTDADTTAELDPSAGVSADTTVYAGWTEAVAYSGSSSKTYYASVQDALDSASKWSATKITLLADITESLSLETGRKAEIDLAGHKIVNAGDAHTIANAGTLTISDSSADATGAIDNTASAKAALYNDFGATVTVKGGSFTRSAQKAAGGYYVVKNLGTATLAGGTFKFNDEFAGATDDSKSGQSLVANGWYNSKDGTGYGQGAAKLTITGGTFTGGLITIKNDDYGELEMTGGTINQTVANKYAIFNVNKATISGGTITARHYAVYSVGMNGSAANDGTLTVKDGATIESETAAPIMVGGAGKAVVEGGAFKAAEGKNVSAVNDEYARFGTPSVAVSGGSFNVPVRLSECAEGYMPLTTQNEQGEYTVKAGSAVAESISGDTVAYYENVQAAIDAAADGATIKLLGNVTESVTVAEGQNVTLDLAGHKIVNAASAQDKSVADADRKHTITNKGTLAIIDSSDAKTGVVDNVSHGRAAVKNEVGGVCTLLAGIYDRSSEAGKDAVNNGGNSYYAIDNQGTMTIGAENGAADVKVTYEGHFSSLIHNGWYDGSQNATKAEASLTIYNGAFSGGLNTVKNDDFGVLDLQGGSYANTTQHAVLNWNVAKISGGTFQSSGTEATIWNGGGNATMDKGQLTITDGTFTNTGSGPAVRDAGKEGAVIAISGGTFSTAPDSSYLVDGFEAVKNEAGGYGVEQIELATVTVNGETKTYSTLKEIAEAANKADGATVHFLRSVMDHSSITFEKTVAVTAEEGVEFNGTIILNGDNSKVSGFTFLIDGQDLKFNDKNKYESGIKNSVEIHADNVEIADNIFNIPSLYKGEVDVQPNSIWVAQGSDGTNIHKNHFYIGRTHNSSAVGINLVGGAGQNAVTGTVIEENEFTTQADTEGVTSGSAIFLVANGNDDSEDGYGVTDVTVKNNTVNGTANPARTYGVSIGDVKGITLEGNTFQSNYIGVSYSTWGAEQNASHTAYTKLPAASADITLKDNKFPNNTASVYFKATFEDAAGNQSVQLVTPAEQIAYEGGQTINFDKVEQYRVDDKGNQVNKAPVAPTGLVFAGWYTDEALTTPLAKDSTAGTAYAKFVPVSSIVKFMGNALRMDNYVDADGNVDYTQTDMRFSFNVVAPNSGLTVDAWSWKTTYQLADGTTGTLNTKGVNHRAPRDAEKEKGFTDGMVTNLVLVGIDTAKYATKFSTNLSVTYTTDDGTQVTATDARRTRAVKGLAETIKNVAAADSDDYKYADGILNAISTN